MTENIWTALSNELAQATEKAGKVVVAVEGRRHPASGVLFTHDSVVTTSHTVAREEEVTVVLSAGTKASARFAGSDPGTGLAVLRLHHSVPDAPPLWGKALSLRVGELVLALGRSWRGNVVASAGILSGLINSPWKTWRGGELDQFIRPDLTFYPGFSGGPMVNSKGEILGINTSGLHRSGITIPSATVARVAQELLEKGRVERPYLGLAMQAVALPESLRSKLNLKVSEGLLIVHVEPASPAEKAGVLLGDILIEIQGKPVADIEAVQQVLHSAKIGSTLEVGLARAGNAAKVKIKLEARPAR
jgi:serine protease DegQ